MQSLKVLLIVDLQKGFVTEHSRHVVKPIEKLQSKFDHVIATQFVNPTPSPFRDILGYDKLSEGDSDTEFAFSPRKDARIITRPSYTCVNGELTKCLYELGSDEVYICGIATEACVLKTALDLFEQNIRSWLICDLCASDQDEKYHHMALKLLAKLINKVHLIKQEDIPFQRNAA